MKNKELFSLKFRNKLHNVLYPKNGKEILSIAWHIFIQLFIAAIIAQINILLFTWYDGRSYYAVISKITVLFTTFQFIPSLIASGVLVVGGKLMGEKREKELPLVVSTGILVNSLICLIVVGILEGVSPYLLEFQGAKKDAFINSSLYPKNDELKFAVNYFRIQIIQLFIMSFAQVYIAALQVYRKQKHIMIGGIVSNLIDVFIVSSCLYWWKVDPIYVAISIPIANLFQLVYMMIINYKIIGFKITSHVNKKRINKTFMKDMIKIGVPITLEIALWNICNFMSQGAIASLHAPNQETNNLFIELNRTINAINQYNYTILQAMATTTSILVAKSVGEKNKEETYQIGIQTWRISVYAQFIPTILTLTLIHPLLMAFNTPTFLITKYGYLLWTTIMFKILGDTVNMTLLRALWTVGDLWQPLMISIITMAIGMVGYPWLIVWLWKGDTGYGMILIYLGLMLDPIVRSFIYIKIWQNKKWFKYIK